MKNSVFRKRCYPSATLLKNLILSLIVGLNIGCTKENDQTLQFIKVVEKIDPDLRLTDFTESLKIIPLETLGGSLVGKIVDVKYFDEKIFILDLQSGVLVFDSEGRFISKVGKKGDGPGEYKFASSIAIDKNNGLIYIASYRKLLIFSKNFQLVEEKTFPFFLNHLEFVKGSLMVFSDKNGVSSEKGYINSSVIYKFDQDIELKDSIQLRSVLLKDKSVGAYFFQHYISQINDEIYFYKPVLTNENILRDTLYKLEEDRLTPYIKFNFDIPQSLDENGIMTTWIYNVFTSSSYIILEYEKKDGRRMFFYDKKKNMGYNLNEGILDKEGVPVFLRPLDLENDTFYYIKSKEYRDTSIEEKNPEIGIVKFK
jgi:hypothetical protein